MLSVIAVVLFGTIVQSSHVLEFTDDNFKSEIGKHETTLVEFYAPWCGHCKRLAPDYEAAANKLQKKYSEFDKHPVKLVKVDCVANTKICKEFGVSGYPTLKIFKNGDFAKEYDGPRDTDGIMKKMVKESSPSVVSLSTQAVYETFISGDGVVVVGFFEDDNSNDAKTFKKVADTEDAYGFGMVTSVDIMEKTKYNNDIVLFRPKLLESKFEDTEVKYSGSVSSFGLKSFCDTESVGLCGIRTTANAEKFPKPTFVAFYDMDYKKNRKGANYWRNRLMTVGMTLKGVGHTVHLAVSNKLEMHQEMEECGISDVAGDAPFVCAYDEAGSKFNMKVDFTVANFEQFVRDVLDGKSEPFLKSEPIPDNTNADVKVAVAKNYDELVNDETKDVLIEFYAPWCGHCKSLAPKFDKLAKKLQNEPGLVIAKMDATANDVPHPYKVEGFPTIYFSARGNKSNPKRYDGGREVKDFLKYLAMESTDELVDYDRSGKRKGSKKSEL